VVSTVVIDARLRFVVVGCCNDSLGLAWNWLVATDEPSDLTWDRRFIASEYGKFLVN
jgi:hypothetical protein